jgi:hypothetical protein
MLRAMRILFFAVTLSLSFTGTVWGVCPTGDLNTDCVVDIKDLELLAERWLADTAGSADLDADEQVGMIDLALLADNWLRSNTPVVISEFMASNSENLPDPQGQYDDWIELHNAGDEAIDIGGMYLTDDLDQPTMWRIPDATGSATIIPARGYLLIWADEDLQEPGIHADFRLSSDGEEIGLFDRDGVTLIDSMEFGEQTADVSYGRYPDVGTELRFFGFPTPGAQNNSGYLGAVAAPKFSRKRGFYDDPVSVTLSTETEDATILYTLDGRVPNDGTGRFFPGKYYINPVIIRNTTCLRAMAVKPGWKSSKIVTHTYILNASSTVKALPVLSLVGDSGKTFYEPDGVMAIVGGYYNSQGKWTSSGAGSYNHPMQRGKAYERPVSCELIKPEDNTGFQTDCGLRVHGSNYMRPRYRRSDGYWSGNTKFSLRLYFRGQYGDSWLEYPFFPPFEVEKFKSVVIRGGHNDRVNPFIKDELLRRLHKDMGHVDSGGMMANVLINGEYKGYFNPCEHIKDGFCQQWYDSDKDWDVMTMNGVRDGDSRAWNDMLNYARSHDLSNPTYYRQFGKLLDVPAYADYLILQLWSGNWDWPQNNWSAARERSEEGIWRFFIWDAEGGMFSNRLHTVYFDRLNSQGNALAQLYRALKVNRDFRQLFADRIYKHFYNGGALGAANIRGRFLKLREDMLGVIPNMDMYVLNTWVPQRLDIFLDACRNENMFTFTGPNFNINGAYQHGGHISAGDALTITNTYRVGDIYYTLDGSDPRVSGAPGDNGTTSRTTLVNEDAAKLVLVPSRDIGDAWTGGGPFIDRDWINGTGGVGYEAGSGYEDLINIDVTERMRNGNTSCYIRIPFDVGSDLLAQFNYMTLEIRYDDGFIAYLNGSEVARRNFTGSPAWNSQASSGHNDSASIMLESVSLSNAIDTLKPGSNILAIHGLNVSPTSSDFLISARLVAGKTSSSPGGGGGVSPTAVEYTGPITVTESTQVKARVLNGVTWSALNEAIFAVGPVTENLRITEMMFHPADINEPNDPNEEFIELQNIGAETINLNLARFTNGVDFVFPSIEVAPDEYILVVKDQSAFAAQYPDFSGVIAGQYTGSLANNGERIELRDAAGQVIHDFRYGDGWRRITDGQGFSLTIIDPANPDPNSWDEKEFWRASAFYGGSPGWDDTGIVPEPGAVVINELLAHSHAAASDWIELHNTTDKAINIGGWFLSDDADDLTKYEIAEDTTIPPDGYVVFYENAGFGNTQYPGCHVPFALSENGEKVYLSSAQHGVLTGYQEVEDFGASETGVAFGRYYKPSTRNFNFVAMSENTPGTVNAYPNVGPIVINEIMYNPASGNQNEEYIELHNITAEPVLLYRYDKGEPWQFTDGIEFVFPSDPIVAIPAYGYALVVKDIDAFTARYGAVPADVAVLGPYVGQLRNGGEKVELSMPGDVDALGTRYYIRVDRVSYSDGSHPEDCPGGIDLWPSGADGGGFSLNRIESSDYGNDVVNWTAASPSPGQPGP